MVKNFLQPLLGSLRNRRDSGRPDQQRSGPNSKRRGSVHRDIEPEPTDAEATSCGEPSIYQEGLRQAALDQRCTNLTLWDFVDRADHQDFLALKQAWEQQAQLRKKKNQWNDIKFVDTIQGSQYRRWQYKKDTLLRRLKKSVLVSDDMGVQFETRLEISDMTPKAMVSVLQQVPSDLDITELRIFGSIPYTGIPHVMDALIALIDQNDRTWKVIFVSLSPVVCPSAQSTASTQKEEHLEGQRILKKRCRELEEVASCHSIPYVIQPNTQ